mmetsp:Transcript_15903/g.18422  ORF Transcript_15903/g.18422 Transcript_15903/m.18422 type:complete len:80 (+) Transcript_15903:421-660(+)
MRTDQVYKWGYDRKKRLSKEQPALRNKTFPPTPKTFPPKVYAEQSNLNDVVRQLLDTVDREGILGTDPFFSEEQDVKDS